MSIGQTWIPENDTESHPIFITKIQTSVSEKSFPGFDEMLNIPSKELSKVQFCILNMFPIAINTFADDLFCSHVEGK
ncbi:hypothetical protein [Legionella israelensis]|uniref:hypothetical protein n=1 Tax=Legionella israelensis TaxID=454 RepID=UPI0010415F17|nr:hypothetical protein [Legionella israelensis]QBS10513.1 hypothetical protein E4T55_12035 [Legionella israelensis]